MLDGAWLSPDRGTGRDTLLCFSHLRWDFVFQRPQHLLSRAARNMRVIYWEEPVWGGTEMRLDQRMSSEGVLVVQPRFPDGTDWAASASLQRTLLDGFTVEAAIADPVLWYYTPQALAFSSHLDGTVVYDCMDELSAFKFADPALPARERDLMAKAAVVFTGGHSIYEAKRQHHPKVHAFPSGVDAAHFLPARGALPEPADQAAIPHPRMGFYGVLDERFDLDLLAATADLRPGTHFVMVGPVAKLDPDQLPQRPNIHYLGPKSYPELPSYLAGWDVALMPFALNEATRFISPTKTPEYLAGGRPVVSTAITDVVRQYGGMPCVCIAGDAAEFAAATDAMLALDPDAWLPAADAVLADKSWDAIWDRMAGLLQQERRVKAGSRP